MTPAAPLAAATRLHNAAGLVLHLLPHGGLQRIDAAGVTVNLFFGHAAEPGPANLWLRLHGATLQAVPLLGPHAPLGPLTGSDSRTARASGAWQGLQLELQWRLAADELAWFWHLHVHNTGGEARRLDLVAVQDLGLAEYGAIRLNEHYVSQYIDLAPLADPQRGWVLAARQNQKQHGRHPWAAFGSLQRAVSYATDAMQLWGPVGREAGAPLGLQAELPGRRLQHEHALAALQDESFTLAAGERTERGFFALAQADHPGASAPADLAALAPVLALPEARALAAAPPAPAEAPARSLFVRAPWLPARELHDDEITALFGAERRHEERDGAECLSFFHGAAAHVVLRAKEQQVQRPHGHILRGGTQLVPDECALTSTVWMAGVFHSMLTQGHVSINRCLSTQRGYLGLFRAHGQRVFVEQAGGWVQLGLPSAFEIEPDACRWLYRWADALLEVRAAVDAGPPQAAHLTLRWLQGTPARLLVTHHVALGGDDGAAEPLPPWRRNADGVWVGVPAGSELHARFPGGGMQIEPLPGSAFVQIGGDELLFDDGGSQQQPFVCVVSAAVQAFGLRLRPCLVPEAAAAAAPEPLALPALDGPAAAAPLAEMLPWFAHNALVHYLAPRGLEQFSGGGWGTRDVCQGPLEALLALGHLAPAADLLRRVFGAQGPDGDWPQWFMFFERERDLRAPDSHGDIVLWPLLALARYLGAGGDPALLDEPLPFHAPRGAVAELAPLWGHAQRALAVAARRRIAGTALAAYGHGDWNDSLQPADPALREHLCSAWTVTLHHQALSALAAVLPACGRAADAAALQLQADAVQADFQRLLVAGDQVAGYALFEPGRPAELLLHPRDRRTGLQHSLLPMMHAALADLLTPAQARRQRALIGRHLTGPDGARLFDRPLAYRGGPQHLFQRAESSAFFGREIGLMYMHAQLRYAEMLAHLGEAEGFVEALLQAVPIGLRERVPAASRRQANCYYSSSDAAFPDRYAAERDYAQALAGRVALDGGWRIYSSGPGIALALVVTRLLGLRRGRARWVLDPVLPPAFDGLSARLPIDGRTLVLRYTVAPGGGAVEGLTLDGRALDVERLPHPYRTGGVALPLDVFAASAAPVLQVRIGGG